MEKIDVMNLSARDLCLLADLTELAKMAHDYAERVKRMDLTFKVGQNRVRVYEENAFDEYYGEGYITPSGLYSYHDNWWGGRNWELYLDEESIYKTLRAGDLLEKGRRDLVDPSEYDLEQFLPHLYNFLDSLK